MGRLSRRVDSVSAAARVLEDARRLVVLSGAGVSTESGVPDFRSPGGVWETFDPSDFEYGRFLADPEGFWMLRARLMDALALDRARPNPAHDALADASRSTRFLGHVTQNIDGLFAQAGHAAEKLVRVHIASSARRSRHAAATAERARRGGRDRMAQAGVRGGGS